MKNKQVTFEELSDWQKSDCLFCEEDATMEAVYGEGNVISRVRCCAKDNCKQQAEEMALLSFKTLASDSSNRKDHLQWSKDRAFEILDKGGSAADAWNSFLSDMTNNDETSDHVGLELGTLLVFGGHNSNPSDMKKFIEDFN